MADRSALTNQIVETIYNNYAATFAGVPKETAAVAIDLAINKVMPDKVALSTVSPDYDSVLLQLAAALSEENAWKDIVTSATGQAILRFIASGIDFAQFSIERAVQEAFPHSASSRHSVNAAMNMIGVRLIRNLPGTISVKFTRPDSSELLEVPAFSPFKIEGYPFFNRTPIIFPANILEAYVTLVQGEVYSSTVQGTGLPYFELELGDGTEDLTEDDVHVYVGGEKWLRDKDRGPWTFQRGEKVAYDTTAPNGNLRLQFGNGEFGAMPKTNQDIQVIWCRTLHDKVPSLGAALTATYNGPDLGEAITGETLTTIANAKKALTKDFYVRYGPHIRAEENRAVRRAGYPSLAVKYPGVKDALFLGQAELGAHKRSMMNVVGATVLTETTMTNTQWENFIDYMQENSIFQCEFLRLDPTAINVALEADIYCRPASSLDYVKSKLTTAINDLFALRPGWLGYSLHLSDITDALEGVGELGGMVEYVKLISPTAEIDITNKSQYIKLTSLTLNMNYTSRDSLGGRGDLLRSY